MTTSSIRNKNIHKNKGFSLLEILVAAAILAILTTVAIPSFQETIKRNRVDGEAQKLFGVFKQVRNNAFTTNSPSFVCRTTSENGDDNCDDNGLDSLDWGVGLITYTALQGTVVPAPDNRFDNQKLQEIESTDPDLRQQMVQKNIVAPRDGLMITSAGDDYVVRFNSDGSLANDAPFRVSVCDSSDDPERYGQIIEINRSGQIRLTKASPTSVNTNLDCTPTAL